MRDFHVFIVSRNRQILSNSRFSSLLGFYPITVVEAALVEDLQRHSVKGIHGLSRVEVAISLSHHLARKQALTSKSNWCVFLEEDANLTAHFSKLKKLTETLDEVHKYKGFALGIHLFPEQYGILCQKGEDPYLAVIKMPDYAVGYALNRLAIKTAVENFNQTKIELADWPKYIRNSITWKAPLESLVTHPDLNDENIPSSTRSIREKRKQSSLLRKLFRLNSYKYVLFRIAGLYCTKFGQSNIHSKKLRTIVFLKK